MLLLLGYKESHGDVYIIFIETLLKRDEPGTVGGTNTRTTVLHRLVCDRELSQIMTNHLRLEKEKLLPVVILSKCCTGIKYSQLLQSISVINYTFKVFEVFYKYTGGCTGI